MNKTLLISEIFPPTHGGSGRWFWELYSRLPKNEYVIAAGDVDGAKPFDNRCDLSIERVDMATTSWSSWGISTFSGIKFYIKTFLAIRVLIKKHDIKNIHCGRCIPEGFVAYLISKLYGIPYLCFIHGEDVTNAARSREFKWIVAKTLNGASSLICNSQNSSKLLIKDWGIDPDKISVLNPGVDTKRFFPVERSFQERKQLEWHERPVILTVSRLEERKGHDCLIKALPEVKKIIPDVLYAIIGDGPEFETLKKLSHQLDVSNNVIFMSELEDEDMIKCYQQCDVFVLPNRTINNNIEGFGMVLVEAQSCGKPVIGGNSGGTPETMIINESGFVVDCSASSEPLAEKLVTLLSDTSLRNKMGKVGREHVVKTLDWTPHVASAKLIFQKLKL